MEEKEQESVKITLGRVQLEGLLGIPKNAKSVVLFAHGSGSSRFSSRNNFVAKELRRASFGTLLFDLLTEAEDRTYENRFDIQLLSNRLSHTTEWVLAYDKTKSLRVGYFGASTGAAAALQASTTFAPGTIAAIVSRGGRPDLALKYLGNVTAPTMLIVGGNDEDVIHLNKVAYDRMTCKKRMEIVPGATHLFEEPGTLEEVARLAVEWFTKFL